LITRFFFSSLSGGNGLYSGGRESISISLLVSLKSFAKWLQEQEARLQELKDQEKARQREQEAAAAAAAQAGIYSGVAPELLNNQIPSAPPGNLTYVPNDFNDTNRLIDKRKVTSNRLDIIGRDCQ
jgi:hypothetical protein